MSNIYSHWNHNKTDKIWIFNNKKLFINDLPLYHGWSVSSADPGMVVCGVVPHPCPWSRGSPSSPELHGQSSVQTPRCNRAMFLTSLAIDKQPEETNDTISFLLIKRLPPYLIHCVSCLGSRTCWWRFFFIQGGQNFTTLSDPGIYFF